MIVRLSTEELRRRFGNREPLDLDAVPSKARAILEPANQLGLVSPLDRADAIANTDSFVRRRDFLPAPSAVPPDGDEWSSPAVRIDRPHRARAYAASVWAGTSPLDAAGERYLASRGLDPTNARIRSVVRATPILISPPLVERWPELARVASYFNRSPGICVALRSPLDGRAMDVRERRFDPSTGDVKVIGMKRSLVCAGGELYACYGAPHRLERDRVVVVEGLVDFLTALQAWPDADVLGAADAGTVPLVAHLAAHHVRASNGRLSIVVHADSRADRVGAGERAGAKAVRRAMALGLRLDRDVFFVDIGNHGDLNDAFRAGWRP